MINIDNGLRIEEFRGSLNAKCGELLEYKPNGMINEIEDVAGYIKAVEGGASSFVLGTMNSGIYKTGIDEADVITSEMWGRLSEAARLLLRKLIFSAPIIVRFHNDADGSSGACSLYSSVKGILSLLGSKGNFVWMMQKSVSYGPSDSGTDMLIANNYSCMEKPLLIMIDFGTTVDSNIGIAAIKDRFDVIWLDHHPISEGFDGLKFENYINPWRFGGNSNYTAGLLTSVFCKTFSDVDTREFEQASLIGDYSDYGDPKKGTGMSTLLDFVTSDLKAVYGNSKSNVTPQEIESLLSNKKRSGELLSYANMRLEEALDNGMKNLKGYSSRRSRIYVLDFKDIRSEDSKYPLPGRFSSKLLDRIVSSEGGEAILIVHAGPYISIRISKNAGTGIDLLGIIKGIKGHYSKSIEAGGGHLYAAGIKVADEADKKEIIRALINRIKES